MYPIWWGIAAWPMNTFVEANDFTGKIVIPFCTASSSGIGDSRNLLADLAGTGDWQEGMIHESHAFCFVMRMMPQDITKIFYQSKKQAEYSFR